MPRLIEDISTMHALLYILVWVQQALGVKELLDLPHHLYRRLVLRVADIWSLHYSQTVLSRDRSVFSSCSGQLWSYLGIARMNAHQ